MKKVILGVVFCIPGPLVANGIGQEFGEEILLNNELESQTDVDYADLDGDGDLDLLSVRIIDRQVTWAENLGQGLLSGFRSIGFEVGNGYLLTVRAADLDGDGDLDVLKTHFSPFVADSVGWHENLGSAIFADYQLLAPSPVGGSHGRAADLDGDGDLDVAMAFDNTDLIWLENLGAGTFGPSQVVATANMGLSDLELADLDGDGRIDFVWSDEMGNTVSRAMNLGSGQFGPQQSMGPFNTPYAIDPVDLDSDGDMDLLIVGGGIYWLENMGMGNFAQSQFVASGNGVDKRVSAADMDGDGDIDLLSGGGSHASFQFAVHENLGGSTFAPSMTLDLNVAVFVSVNFVDLDSDGDPDPILAGRELYWAENTGAPFGPVKNLGFKVLKEATVVDFDGDADFDLLHVHWGEVFRTENLGGEVFAQPEGIPITITSGAAILKNVDTFDVDGDGDLDLLSGASDALGYSAYVHWHENQNGTFVQHSLLYHTSLADGAHSLESMDMEGDGDLDILVLHHSAFNPSSLTSLWLRNDGGAVFTVLPGADHAGAGNVTLKDLDGDGLLDLVMRLAWNSDYRLAWYRNLGSSLGPENVLGMYPNRSLRSLDAADFDGDGDSDILLIDGQTNSLDWMANQGNGVFSGAVSIGGIGASGQVALGRDVDLDGDSDAIALTPSGGHWFENLGGGVFGVRKDFENDAGAWNVGGADMHDLDGDGDLDFLKTAQDGLVFQHNQLRFGQSYCLQTALHSGLSTARIYATGSVIAANNDCSLVVNDMPSFQFGYFIVAQASGLTVMPASSQGNLCLGSSIGRMNRTASEIFMTNAQGMASVDLDLTDVPTPLGPVVLQAGQTRYFQAWFRDHNPGPTSNFTDGLRVRFE